MKRALAIVVLVAGVLFGPACTHYLPASAVIPLPSQVRDIEIALPAPSRGFSLDQREAVARLVSFLGEGCHWTAPSGEAATPKRPADLAYRIVIHRTDGTALTLEVPAQAPGDLVTATGYVARLSKRASGKLDQLVGVATVHLHVF